MMRLRATRLGVLAAVTGLLLACGGDDGDDGGTAGTGGKCPIDACGGDPTGTWTVKNLCVSDEQKLFAATVNQKACADSLKSVENVMGSGEYKLGADKNAISSIVVSGTGKFSFTDACVKALGIGQAAATDCTKVEGEFKKESAVKAATCAAAGANCDCTITSDISLAGNGSYTVANKSITVSGLTQPFCVEGNTLELQATRAGTTLLFTLTK
jgi:hypothetical protein